MLMFAVIPVNSLYVNVRSHTSQQPMLMFPPLADILLLHNLV